MSKTTIQDVIKKLANGQRTGKKDAGILQAAGFDDHWVIRRVSSGSATGSDVNRIKEWYSIYY